MYFDDLYIYRCNMCNHVLFSPVVFEYGVKCCKRDMDLLTPDSIEASKEIHIPCYEKGENKVEITVGKEPHPMTKEHHIEWIALVTNKGSYKKHVQDSDRAFASFQIDKDEEIHAIYSYCNLHGLWHAKNIKDDKT